MLLTKLNQDFVRIKLLKADMITNSPSLLMLVMILAMIYSLADSTAVSDATMPDKRVWNPSLDDSASGSSEAGVGLAGFLDSSESGHVSTFASSFDHEFVADGRTHPCSTPKMKRRDPQSCRILPDQDNTNTRGSVGNPGNSEGSEENQKPRNNEPFTPLPGGQFYPDILDWDFSNLQGWKICPRSKSDNKPLTAVCDSGNPEDIVSAGIGWKLSNVTPCTYDG